MLAPAPPRRPMLRYHGGKWRLAPWIISHLPPHRVYVEPFGGAASVLLRKPRSYAEVLNDQWNVVVDFYRVMRDPASAARLRELVQLTPYSRQELVDSYMRTDDPVEAARRLLVRSFAGFGSAGMTRKHRTGFRSNVTRSYTTPALDWARWPQHIQSFIDRLTGVVIENRSAIDVIKQFDGPETLFYLDPPYPWSTRSKQRQNRAPYHAYANEMTDDDHRALAVVLRSVRGMVVMSGYPCDLYDSELYSDWHRVDRAHFKDGARKSTEVLWLNGDAASALEVAA